MVIIQQIHIHVLTYVQIIHLQMMLLICVWRIVIKLHIIKL
jgi:hypothetical protein